MSAQNDFAVRVITTFAEMKRIDTGREYQCIPVLNNESKVIAFLKPVTMDYRIILPQCVAMLTKWRASYPSLANSVFHVTEERTSKWIDNLVLKKEDRLLFMIDDIDNHHLGQIALANFDYEERRGCIDSACHGERGNVHDLMFFVFKTLSRWMVSRLGAEEICLKTNTDNFRALNLYHRIGFHEIKEVPLFRRDLGDEIRWDPEPNRNPVEAERSEYIMQLDMTTL